MIRTALVALALAATLLVACSSDKPSSPLPDDAATTQADSDSTDGEGQSDDVSPPPAADTPDGDAPDRDSGDSAPTLPRVVVQWSPRMPQAGGNAFLSIESVNRDFRAVMVVLTGPANEVITLTPTADRESPANNRWSADVQLPTPGAWHVTVIGQGDVRIERTLQVVAPQVPLIQRPGLPLPGRVTTVRVLDPDTYAVRAEWTARDAEAVWLAGEPPEVVFTRLVAGEFHLIAGNPVTGDTRLLHNTGIRDPSLRLVAAPNGSALAFWPQFSGRDDARIRIFRQETGRLIDLDGPAASFFIGEWSPDSSVLLVRGGDNRARFLDANGALLYEATGVAPNGRVAWIDGNIALVEGHNRDDSIAAVRRIDPHSGQDLPILTINDRITEIGAWRVSPDGDRIAAAVRTQPTADAWGLMTQPIASATTNSWTDDPGLQLDVDEVHAIAWTETGALIVAAFAGEGEDRQFILSEVDPDARTSRLLLTRESRTQWVGSLEFGLDRIYVRLVRCCHPPGAYEVLTIDRATGQILATDIDADVLSGPSTGPYLSNDTGLLDAAGRTVLDQPGMHHTIAPTPAGPVSLSLWAHLVGTSLEGDPQPPDGPAALAVVSEQQRDSLALYEIPLTPVPDPATQRLLTSSSDFIRGAPTIALDDNHILEWANHWLVGDLSSGGVVEIDPGHDAPTVQAYPSIVPAVAVSPDGDRLAHFALVHGGLTLTISSLDTGLPLLRSDPIADGLDLERFAGANPRVIAGPVWSPDGTRIAAGHVNTIVIMDATNGELAFHQLVFTATDLTWPQADHIYVGTRNDGLTRLTLADGRSERVAPIPGGRSWLSLAPNRAAIAVANDRGVWVWNIPGEQLTLVGSPDGLGALQRPAWSPASDRIAYATTVPDVFSGRIQIAAADGSGAYFLVVDDFFFGGWVLAWTDAGLLYTGGYPGGN